LTKRHALVRVVVILLALVGCSSHDSPSPTNEMPSIVFFRGDGTSPHDLAGLEDILNDHTPVATDTAYAASLIEAALNHTASNTTEV
jgi:hypothetical protein